ncbi:MAG: hypothetical protein AAFZ15_34040 [Bacteroidota bacterium]
MIVVGCNKSNNKNKSGSIFLMLVCIYILGCHQVQGHKTDAPIRETEIEEPSHIEPDASVINYYKKLGFQKEDGRFLKYFCEGNNLFIKYGNNEFEKTMKDTFYCEMPYVGTPMLWAVDQERILLSFGCGSPCWGLSELPLNQKDSVETYMYHYDFDKENSLLVHVDYYEPKDDYVLLVRNLSTKQIEVVEIEDCGSAFLGYCIDSLSFIDRELFVRSRTKEEIDKQFDAKGSKIVRRKINI